MTMFLFMAVTVFTTVSCSKAWEQYDKCDLEYEKVGCFLDRPGDKRSLPEELLNERDETNPKYDGHRINWNTYNESIHGLACRCAAKTRDMGYKVFGLQFYGECWSGSCGENTYDKHGDAERKKCIQDIYSSTDIYCEKSRKQECIGGPHTNYVYRLKQAYNESLDIGIIMDGSSSVEESDFWKAKDFLKNMTEYFKVSPQEAHFGVIVYNTKAKIEFTMADCCYNKSMPLSDRIEAIEYPQGGTRTDRALEMASNELFTAARGDRPDNRNLLIVFTDGKTNKGSKPYSEVLPQLQAKCVQIITVGMGEDVNEKELLTIANKRADNIFMLDNFDCLKTRLDKILE